MVTFCPSISPAVNDRVSKSAETLGSQAGHPQPSSGQIGWHVVKPLGAARRIHRTTEGILIVQSSTFRARVLAGPLAKKKICCDYAYASAPQRPPRGSGAAGAGGGAVQQSRRLTKGRRRADRWSPPAHVPGGPLTSTHPNPTESDLGEIR